MRKYFNPEFDKWSSLTDRPALNREQLNQSVKNILSEVMLNGDKALINFSQKFDSVNLEQLVFNVSNSNQDISPDLKEAIQIAKGNIEAFHKSQIRSSEKVTTSPGVNCWRKYVPIERVGLYIPGGTAPLFSSLLMLAIPAKIAACKEIVICTPPNKSGEIDAAIIETCRILGIEKVYLCGGAQAIAAMAYGTETIPKVDKIFGPGNQYVTAAKSLIQEEGIAIDMPAGPSEVLVIADEKADPGFVAADLLSQAEHGKDSQVILLSNSEALIEKTLTEIEIQISSLPREKIARSAIQNSRAIVFDTLETCLDFSNLYAPEHLIINTTNADDLAEKVINAGSVFIGQYSSESAGDYASGTNHTLPTNGYAKSYSSVSLDSFMKAITFQKIEKEGLVSIGKSVELMAEAEGLQAHKNAISIRLKSLEND